MIAATMLASAGIAAALTGCAAPATAPAAHSQAASQAAAFNDGFATAKADDCQQGSAAACAWVSGRTAHLAAPAVTLTAAHTAPAFGVSISPAHVKMPPNSWTQITVADTGSQPVHIGTSVRMLAPVTGHPGAWVPGKTVAYAKVRPGGFTLAPGQSRQIRVDVLPSAGPWHRDLAVAVLASQAGQHSQARAAISAAAAAHVVVPGKARPAAAYTYHAPPAQPGHSAPWGLLALILAALATVAGVTVRQIRHRREVTPTS